MGDEHKEQDHQRNGTGLLRAFWAFLALVVFYVMSTGPVTRFAFRHPSMFPVPSTVYAPLALVGDRSSVVADLFDWYVDDVWKARD